MAAPTPQDPSPPAGWYERSWRWWVLATLFLATFLNYLDRQTLSVSADPICAEFGIDNEARGKLLAAFVYSYAFSHLFIGFLLDRIRNIRLFFPVMVVGWSVSNMLVGFARSHTQILWLRYLLGVWESANFPLCLLLIARIFPARERSFAAGIFNSGAVIASLVAPKLVIWISTHWNWRYSFIVTGAFGLLWVIPWWLIFRQPERRARAWPSAEKSGAGSGSAAGVAPRASLASILRSPAFWGVVIAGMGFIPGWYFVSQWLPSYLTHTWKMPYDQILGNRLTIIYLFQDIGLWVGGGVVWWLARRGLPILTARKTVIAVAYMMMMIVLAVPLVQSAAVAIVMFCIFVFGMASWQANQQAFKQDVAAGSVATVAALVGFCETGFSAFIVQKVGAIVQQHGGYNAVFLLFGGFFTVALAAVFALLRPRWLKIQEHGVPAKEAAVAAPETRQSARST